MTHISMTHTSAALRSARTRSVAEHVGKRVRDLAEAGARGRALSPREVREVCEALQAQPVKAPTHFHSGFG